MSAWRGPRSPTAPAPVRNSPDCSRWHTRWPGRAAAEADAVLGQIDPAGLSEDQLMAWALPQAANQFWMLSEPERATAFLRATRRRVSTPAAQSTLDALAATFAMNAGAPQRALGLAQEVLASPRPTTPRSAGPGRRRR